MIIYKAYKVRIYPNTTQTTQINKTLGCCRALYNMMLYERIQTYTLLKDDKRKLYEHKYKTEKEYKQEFEWLKEADSQALQQSRINLTTAYSNFFKSLSDKRKGKSGFPKFKKKKTKNSYRTTMTSEKSVEILNDKIKLPKIGWVKFRNKMKPYNGCIKNATVSRSPTGKFFVSILFECDIDIKPVVQKSNPKIKGLDMSMDSFYIDEYGKSPVNFERLYRKNEPKLKHLQQQLSRKQKGSKNWYKSIHKINVVYESITNKRKDFTNKLSKKLITENDVIVVESLSLKGMSQALNLGKSVMDLGYSEFIRQLRYKSLWYNKTLIEADKWFASSKTCNFCGYKKKDLQLSERVWMCPNCGKEISRDMNAGRNLVDYGLQELNLEKIGWGSSEFKPVEKKTSGIEKSIVSHASLKQENRKIDTLVN